MLPNLLPTGLDSTAKRTVCALDQPQLLRLIAGAAEGAAHEHNHEAYVLSSAAHEDPAALGRRAFAREGSSCPGASCEVGWCPCRASAR
jgi:hypothetical protein